MNAGTVMLPLIGAEANAASVDRLGGDHPFDDDWRFFRGEGQRLEAPGIDDSG